ncbi:hypothetical protein [Foetidibacter luteolus]|uniref:hypothetical protein n=1 Tax=Foetidibacter luteolus TaxID=2608880 RepID=UPI00129C03C9|nr:hypothetical protein [Foetidibacter luteolus]
MVKKSILLALSLLSLFISYAQDDAKKVKLGIGTAPSLTVGNLKNNFSYGVGVQFLAKYTVSKNISVFAQTGVDLFKNKYANHAATSLMHIPLVAGMRLTSNGFFAGSGVGFGIWDGGGMASNGLHFSPQIGYEWKKCQVFGHYGSTKVSDGSLSYAGIAFFVTF